MNRTLAPYHDRTISASSELPRHMETVESGSQSPQQALEDCSGEEDTTVRHGLTGDLPLANTCSSPSYVLRSPSMEDSNRILVRRVKFPYYTNIACYGAPMAVVFPPVCQQFTLYMQG